MPAAIRHTLLSLRDLLVSFGPFVVLTVTLLALAYWWLNPNPPKHVTLATGPAQSAYAEFGKRYQSALAASGIRVELVASEGSSDNLRLLREGKVDLGFVQGGSAEAASETEAPIDSLGSLFVEPVWLFYREGAAKKVARSATLDAMAQLQGLRLNVGTEGSGVPTLMGKLFEANRVDPQKITLSRLSQTPATVAFLGGELDALVFASAPESLMVQMLLQTPGVKLMDFAQSEAYSRRLPFLTPVVLPRGVVDLASDQPAQDVHLIASTTSLLARDTTHPALLQLFAMAARDMHGPAGWFNRAGTFPNGEHGEFALSAEAERALQGGKPLLQRWLPFWLANLVERMWLALGIILAILLPLSRVVPPLYQFRVRSRVFKWYAQLREIEATHHQAPEDTDRLIKELDDIDEKVGKVNVPLSYADELYALRNNIHSVRNRLLRTPPN